MLKFIIPPLSVIALYAVYRFTKNISSSTKTAFFAGILLLCGTPYLHWTTQAVRETMGIALFALALYVSFTAIQSHKKQYLLLSLLLTWRISSHASFVINDLSHHLGCSLPDVSLPECDMEQNSHDQSVLAAYRNGCGHLYVGMVDGAA